MDAAGSTRESASSQRTALTRRYSLIIGLAYVVLVAAAVGFFLSQTEEREKAEWETIAGRVKEQALILDALAGALADRVKAITQDAVPDAAKARAGTATERKSGVRGKKVAVRLAPVEGGTQ